MKYSYLYIIFVILTIHMLNKVDQTCSGLLALVHRPRPPDMAASKAQNSRNVAKTDTLCVV